jgi:hypothetical protein
VGVVALYKTRCCPYICQGGLRKTTKISDRIRNPIRPGYTGTDPVLLVLKPSVPVSRRTQYWMFSTINTHDFCDSQATHTHSTHTSCFSTLQSINQRQVAITAVTTVIKLPFVRDKNVKTLITIWQYNIYRILFSTKYLCVCACACAPYTNKLAVWLTVPQLAHLCTNTQTRTLQFKSRACSITLRDYSVYNNLLLEWPYGLIYPEQCNSTPSCLITNTHTLYFRYTVSYFNLDIYFVF